jgi:heptosyltransferase-3
MKKIIVDTTAVRNARRRLAHSLLSLLFRPLPPQPRCNGAPASIILFCQEKLGDAILFTPLLANLRRALPECRISLLAFGDAAADFFSNDTNLSAVYNVKKNRTSLIAKLRNSRFDLLFCPKDHFSFSAIFYARIIPAQLLLGIDHPLHRGFFNHLLRYEFQHPVALKNCGLLDYLGIQYTSEQCAPSLPPYRPSGKTLSFLESTDLTGAIGINLSAGESDREWPTHKWLELLKTVNRRTVIFAMPGRADDKRHIEAAYSRAIVSPSTGTIFDAASIISRLDLLISPDTALVHAAACVNTPVVGLYRADKNHYARFSPYMVPHRMVISATHRVLDIPVDRVADAAADLFAERGKNG